MTPRKTGRPRIEDRAKTTEAKKTLVQARDVAANIVSPPS
jgi:hypothetical protein